MAKSLTIKYCGALLILLVAVTAHAGKDPTRPPPEFMPREEREEGSNARPNAAQAALIVEQQPTLVLQSIIVSAGRQRAIISGQSLAVGERIGNAQLLRLTETQAFLQGSQGNIVLELTPGIRKTSSGSSPVPSPLTSLKSGTPRPPSGDTQ